MNCIHCQQEIDICNALEASPFSWPQSQTIWHVCTGCQNGNHIRFENGIAMVVKLLGSPGNEFEILEDKKEPSIEVKIDPEYLHAWYQGKHYEVKERA